MSTLLARGSPSNLISEAIKQAGLSVTLGCFIGSALTSGIAFGVATAWVANREVLRRLFSGALEILSATHPVDAALLAISTASEPGIDTSTAISITSFADSRLAWARENGEPGGALGGSWSLEDAGTALSIAPAPGRDYWCRTFYTPLLVKHDGQSLVAPVAPHSEASLTTAFTLSPCSQFDQAGVMVVIDENTWCKAGIEFVDGLPRLACVVTNHGFSDWSTAPCPWWDEATRTVSAHVRLSKLLPGPQQGGCLVFEAAPFEGAAAPHWSQIRIASLRARAGQPWRMGVYAQCPITQSDCSARFHHFKLGAKEKPVHEAALPEGHGGL